MKLLLLLLLTGVMPMALSAQSFAFPTFNTPVRSIKDLASHYWHIKDSAFGDLNKDGRPDVAVVLEYADTVREIRLDSIENTGHPRILLVLFQDSATGQLRPVCQNNTFIIREGEGGMTNDPYGSLGIRNNILSVNIEFVRETVEYKFRWQKGDLYLIGASDFGTMATTGDADGWEFNFSTSRARHSWENKSSKGKPHEEWKTFAPRAIKLRDLKQYGAMKIYGDESI